MDNHPIPQDVTGFQFKLIGDMTVKQFAYLTIAAITGWVVYSLPISLFLSIPIAAILVIAGICLSFMPIAGRPLDVMLVNFIKALFAPTQYIYMNPDAANYSLSKSQQFSLASQVQPKIDQVKTTPLFSASSQLSRTITTQPQIVSIVSKDNILKTDEEKSEELQKKEQALEEKLKEVEEKERKLKEEELNTNRPISQEIQQKLLSLEGQLQEMLAQREQLSKQIIELQKRLQLQKRTIFTPSTARPISQTPNVRKIPLNMGKGLGLPAAPTIPNVVAGIVKDPRGNPLSNILVEIKDSNDNPVRAFKTSQLGHFASATPLPNGVYTLIFEDPKGQNKFDAIELNVKNEIIMVLEVVSIDAREELRRSLFGHKE